MSIRTAYGEPVTWLDRQPGLAEAAEDWRADLPRLLDEAAARADDILRASPLDPASLLRLGALGARAAPRVAPALARRDGEAIVAALADAALKGGPTYVKLGQFISSTRGMVPDWIADAFAGCRDAVPPAAARAIEEILWESGIAGRLRAWDRRPIASASVAQVHRATLLDGTEVALKVRRPGVVATVSADAAYLVPLLKLAEQRETRLRLANLSGTFDMVVRLFAQEADLRLEAANIVDMALAFERGQIDVQVPAPIPGLVAKRAMAMEFVEGHPASDARGVAALGHRADELVRLGIAGTLHTTMRDGLFHGDLHAGNVLVNSAGLALVDFGIVGRLNVEQRQSLLALLVAALNEDRTGAFHALQGLGALPPDVRVDELVDLLPERPPSGARPHRREEVAERINAMVRTLGAHGFRVPPELTLFAKNLVYLSDAVRRHAPSFDIVAEVAVILEEIARAGSESFTRE